MTKDYWIIEFLQGENGHGEKIAEKVNSPEEAARILQQLLASRFEDLFRAASPELLLRHMRDTVTYDTPSGRLVIRRVRG